MTRIPEVYQETLERIDAKIGNYYTFGMKDPLMDSKGYHWQDEIEFSYNRWQICGCNQCKKAFFSSVRNADRRTVFKHQILIQEAYRSVYYPNDDCGDD